MPEKIGRREAAVKIVWGVGAFLTAFYGLDVLGKINGWLSSGSSSEPVSSDTVIREAQRKLDLFLQADWEVRQKRPFDLDDSEINETAAQVEVEHLYLLTHFSSKDDEIWVLFFGDREKNSVNGMAISLPVSERSTSSEVSTSFYYAAFGVASARDPERLTEFQSILKERLKTINLTPPLHFKNESRLPSTFTVLKSPNIASVWLPPDLLPYMANQLV